MNAQLFQLCFQLLTLDISILICAKGIVVEQKKGENTNKIVEALFSKDKKNTKLHYLVLIFNFVTLLLFVLSEFFAYESTTNDFVVALKNCFDLISIEKYTLLVWLMIYILISILFMIATYRNVQIIKNDSDGNRHLNSQEIDREYIEFSKPDMIDTHSILLLIAGDLSFLGDVKLGNIKGCADALSDCSKTHKCCNSKRCKNKKCIEKSSQFAQLFELYERKEIRLHIICKHPKEKGDLPYKRRLGRLKKIFGDDLILRFLPDATLGNDVCVLGRIKQNGGIQELFWHWKDPKYSGRYTVPSTKKADTSENKTLIFLLSDLLWKSAQEPTQDKINQYIDEYEGEINQHKKS